MSESPVNVRYMVDDPVKSADWYVDNFGFSRTPAVSPALPGVARGPIRLGVSAIIIWAGRPSPDGSPPAAGGWNRFQFIVEDIEAEVDRLRARGVKFRNDIVSGPGGKQILADDPSGNVVELFQPGQWG